MNDIIDKSENGGNVDISHHSSNISKSNMKISASKSFSKCVERNTQQISTRGGRECFGVDVRCESRWCQCDDAKQCGPYKHIVCTV